MLPPELADFSFHPGQENVDADLAARALELADGGRVLLFGSLRTRLIGALLGGSSPIVVVDSSRSALARASGAFPEDVAAGRLELFAEDPRELEVPGGARVALVPSLPWRAIVLAEDRQRVLTALRPVLDGGGALCLDVENLPRDGALEFAEFTWRTDPPERGVTVLGFEGDDGPVEVDLCDATPEGLRNELLEAGFRVERMDYADGTPSAPRWFIVARA